MSEIVGEANAVVTCGSCGTRLRVRASAEGRKGKCPRCGVLLRIAMPATPAKPVEPAPRLDNPAPHPANAGPLAEKPSPRPESTAPHLENPAPHPEYAAPPAEKPAPHPEEPDAPTPGLPLRESAVVIHTAPSTARGVLAALMVSALGAAAWITVERYGGRSLWVVKHALIAWSIGMSVAAAMLIVGGQRTGPARALCAMLAAFAIVSAMVVTLSGFGPTDSLFLALAVAGSACSFMISRRDD